MKKLIIKRLDSGYLIKSTIKSTIHRQGEDISQKVTAVTTAREVPPIVQAWLSAQRKRRPPLPQPSGPKGSKSGQIKPHKGHVYILQCDDRYKIGRSVDVTRRIADISHMLPFEIETVCVIASDDTFVFEAELHRRYSDRLVEGTKEWFFLDEEDIGHLKGLAEIAAI